MSTLILLPVEFGLFLMMGPKSCRIENLLACRAQYPDFMTEKSIVAIGSIARISESNCGLQIRKHPHPERIDYELLVAPDELDPKEETFCSSAELILIVRPLE